MNNFDTFIRHVSIATILFLLYSAVVYSAPKSGGDTWSNELSEVRSYDGTGNNENNSQMGSVGNPHVRKTDESSTIVPKYLSDGTTPDYPGFPNPRLLSFDLGPEDVFIDDPKLTDLHNGFGQFIAHEVSFTGFGSEPMPAEHLSVDPGGFLVIDATRTQIILPIVDVRRPRNFVTSWIDGSNVYGMKPAPTGAASQLFTDPDFLRTFIDGKLKVGPNNTLPVSGNSFIGGDFDFRISSNVPLAAFHILFVREHNRLCDEIILKQPDWSDEEIYQAARKIVGAEIQSAIYDEYLPSLGIKLNNYKGYHPDIDGSLLLEFVSAIFRFGHSQADQLRMFIDENGTATELPISQASGDFTVGLFVSNPNFIDDQFRGGAFNPSHLIDTKMADDVRDNVVAPPNLPFFPGLVFDLMSIDVQRGRDHGIPTFNEIREMFGLERFDSFYELTHDHQVADMLNDLYGDINDVELFIGLIAEKHLGNRPIGKTSYVMIHEMFMRLRDGDRFWYENDPDFKNDGVLGHMGYDPDFIKGRLLSEIIIDNTGVEEGEIQKYVLVRPEYKDNK